jgi:DNA sulfur modification protein DndD
MKIKNLELKNFRPYFGDIQISFPNLDTTPIYLIHGPNGYGKTSLLLALNWCLYGHKKQSDAYEFFNIIAREDQHPSMSVRMDLEDNERNLSIIRRILCNDPVRSVKDLSIPELLFFENNKKRLAQDPQILQELVNEILPFEASQFSFFDGERIEVYSSDKTTEATKNAISSVLGLTLLAQAKDDVEKLIIEIDKDRRRLLEREGDRKNIAEDMGRLESNIEEARSQKSELELKIKSLSSQEYDLQQQMSSHDSVKVLLGEIDQLKLRRNDLQKEKKQLIDDLKNSMQLLYLDVLDPVIEKDLRISQKRREEIIAIHTDALKNDTSKEILKNIEETGICICGRPADQNHINSIKKILKFKDNEINSEDSAYGINFLTSIISAFEESQSLRLNGSYAQLAARLENIENDIDEIETSISSKENYLRGNDADTIDNLARALERVQKEKSHAEREAGSLQSRLESELNDKKSLDKKIAQISGQIQGLDLLTLQVKLLNKSSEAFGEIINRVAQAKQSDIQESSSKYFRNITNKIHAYERMVINSDFSFGIETSTGTKPPMELISAGEKQVTALSFILGLNEFSRVRAPIFMDTPMGRLDETHRRNVAKMLHDLAQTGRQIILLVTDTDIAFGVYDILKPAIGAEYEIIHNQTNLTSRIERRA